MQRTLLFAALLCLRRTEGVHYHNRKRQAYIDAQPSPILRGLPVPADIPEYELVVARFDENLSWISQVPAFWSVTVLNKGIPDIPADLGRTADVHHCPQSNEFGREGELIAAFIWQRWDSLAEYTAFCQGNPLEHHPEYLQLLNQKTLLSSLQTMSYIYKPGITNADVIEMHKIHPLYRSEAFSLRTLDSLYFRDDYIWQVAQWVAEHLKVPLGTNLVSHYFKLIGLPGWVPEEQEIGRFAYGATVGVHRSKIRQHERDVYARISTSVLEERWTGVLLERCWLMLWGGADFTDL